jgi:hypothetical protein
MEVISERLRPNVAERAVVELPQTHRRPADSQGAQQPMDGLGRAVEKGFECRCRRAGERVGNGCHVGSPVETAGAACRRTLGPAVVEDFQRS